MFLDLVSMNGYGQFVWPAFVFSFACCFSLYLKVRADLKEQEERFIYEYRELNTKKIKFIKRKKSTEEVLSIN